MKKEVVADPPEDIPAWFMTYSDVITLLMTFFILLLTFSTSEPERFEKETVKFFGAAGSTGVVGYKHEKLDQNSSVRRYRPRAARMAMSGSEMPPLTEPTAKKNGGKGLKSASEKASKRDVMVPYAFTVDLDSLVNSQLKLTPKGVLLASSLATQLRGLPLHIALETAGELESDKASAIAHHLFHVEMVRPGHVSIGHVSDIGTGKVRFVLERYSR